jgi:glycosyltransferase involved in cell wall biosynthesis
MRAHLVVSRLCALLENIMNMGRKSIVSKYRRTHVRSMITVVIPVHNREHLITRAIESVISQTLAADEIIVVDDGSSDRTLEVVNDLTRSLSNLQVISLNENVGAARARNIGIERAKGDLIAFLDSDDMWYPEKLRKQVKEFEANKNVVAVFCGLVANRPSTGYRSYHVPKRTINVDDLYHSNLLMTMSCAMIDKKVLLDLGGFDESLPTCEDWDLFIRLAEIGEISVVQEALVEQLMHEGVRLSRDKERIVRDFEEVFNRIYGRISDPRLMRSVRASYEMRMADIFSSDYGCEPFRAMRHAFKGLLLDPSRGGLSGFRKVVVASLRNVSLGRV